MTAVDEDLRSRVTALYDTYGEVCDEGIERWPDLFTDDALYKIAARENYERGLPLATMLCEGRGMLRDRLTAIRRTSVYVPRQLRHLITNVRILAIEGARVRTRANFAVFESFEETGSRVFAAGRYFDVIAQDESGLRFAEKVCVYDGNVVTGSIIYPL
jgi:3-phenylpropionate/cinnamic acid dioxygenase small subunit